MPPGAVLAAQRQPCSAWGRALPAITVHCSHLVAPAGLVGGGLDARDAEGEVVHGGRGASFVSGSGMSIPILTPPPFAQALPCLGTATPADRRFPDFQRAFAR